MNKEVLIALFVTTLAIAPIAAITHQRVLAQNMTGENTTQINPKGSVVNSKYLTITEHRYRPGDFSDIITGMIVNNSTQEVSGISVNAALYDKDNNLITMTSGGFADVSTLPPGDNSAFSVSLFGLEAGNIDHYMLFPSGTP
jgi:hypothetical protein